MLKAISPRILEAIKDVMRQSIKSSTFIMFKNRDLQGRSKKKKSAHATRSQSYSMKDSLDSENLYYFNGKHVIENDLSNRHCLQLFLWLYAMPIDGVTVKCNLNNL